MPKIQYTTTDGATGEVELDREQMTIGRADDNHIVIADGSISSHHAELTFDGTSWTLTDTGSTNGTKAGGRRVDTVNLAEFGAFTLGSVECVFIGDDGGQTASAQTADRVTLSSSTTSSSTGGYASQPYDRAARAGLFGPAKREKDASRTMLMLLGVLGLAACGAAVFMSMNMGA